MDTSLRTTTTLALALLLAAPLAHAASQHDMHAMPGMAPAATHSARPQTADAALPAASLRVEDAWVRWLPVGLPMGGYMTLRNTGMTPLRLTGARSASYGMVMLHQTVSEGGMDRMLHVDAVTIPAGGTLRFAPGGYHLMLMHGAAAVKPGTTVQIELLIAGHAPLQVPFQVRSATGKP